MPRRTLLLLAALLFSLPSAYAQNDRTVSDTVPLAADGHVTIDNHEGSITVTTWDRPEVQYEARIEAERGAGHPERTTVAVDRSGQRLHLKTEHRGSGGGLLDFLGGDGQDIMPVHYTVTMPRTARLTIGDHESTIEVTGLRAALDVDTHDGPLTVSDQQGALRIDSHDGNIAVTEHQGDLRIDTHDSRIRLRGVAGRVEIDTHDSPITAEGLRGPLELDTHEGRAELAFAALDGSVHIDAHDGTFMLALPAAAGFEIDTNFDDDVELASDFDLSAARRADEDDEEVNYRGAVGGGGPQIRLAAHDGQFQLRARR